MGILKDKLVAQPELRPEVVKACAVLLDEEVGRKKGLSGMVVKSGYVMFKRIKPTKVQETIDWLLDDFIEAIDPFVEAHLQSGSSQSLESYLLARDKEIAEALLAITDKRAETTKSGVTKKLYGKLRSTAERNVREAVPGIGRTMKKYL